jgi:hypothetical protein
LTRWRASSPRINTGQRSVLNVDGNLRTNRTYGAPSRCTVSAVAGRAVPPV